MRELSTYREVKVPVMFRRLKQSWISNALAAAPNRFQLLRNFSIISLGGFTLTAVLLSAFYRHQAKRDLVISVEESNVALTQVFSNTLWPEYGTFLSSTQEITTEELIASERIQQLNEDVIAQFDRLTVLKVKVFDLQGRTVFSTDPSQIGDDKSESSGFLAAKTGQVVSQLGHRDTFKALQSTLKDRHLLSSYIPIYSSGSQGKAEGVFEVYTDVTPLLLRIQHTQRSIGLGSILLLSILYAILLLFVRRADQLLTRQHQELQSSAVHSRQQSDQLEALLADLKITQVQMLHSEKMSSLGQMVAGVAHEINNPVSFIYGNLQHVEGYAHDLLAFLQLYEKHYPNPNNEIQQTAEDLDIDFMREDFDKTLSSMKTGAQRIMEIVLSLRNFSRMDESESKVVDIHEGLESTLMILQHRLKAQPDRPEITIIRDFSELPLVECYAGQLNQVFMNILANAIDAFGEEFKEDSTTQKTPNITLRTETRSSSVVISIADNGIGIPPAIKSRIFDPFFTTKEIGNGTGMGLAISHQLITEKHKGKLECFSDAGIGTEFMIEIPIRLSASDTKQVS